MSSRGLRENHQSFLVFSIWIESSVGRSPALVSMLATWSKRSLPVNQYILIKIKILVSRYRTITVGINKATWQRRWKRTQLSGISVAPLWRNQYMVKDQPRLRQLRDCQLRILAPWCDSQNDQAFNKFSLYDKKCESYIFDFLNMDG